MPSNNLDITPRQIDSMREYMNLYMEDILKRSERLDEETITKIKVVFNKYITFADFAQKESKKLYFTIQKESEDSEDLTSKEDSSISERNLTFLGKLFFKKTYETVIETGNLLNIAECSNSKPFS